MSLPIMIPNEYLKRTNGIAEHLETRDSLPRGNGEWVLVVDDETAIRELTTRTLLSFGYQVMSAGGGSEALKVYLPNQNKIALVITDMMMPQGDGRVLILELLNVNPALKIIALSGLFGANGDQIRAIGAKRFLRKPYMANTLIKTVREVLGSQR
jgi:two-component system cell cycle sensor histidine kinase/response regulator CckA